MALPNRASADAPPKDVQAAKCCGCSHRAKSDAPAAYVVQPAQPEPKPVDHAAGCPASLGADWSKLAERAPPVDHLTAIAFSAVLAHLPALSNVAPAGLTHSDSVPVCTSPPSYLKHCALLF
ncbi:hypothetical protein J8F10_02295 [Gemmata sp. G18]|uniref:Uncharacterized protein n=1 Tax=Gemmata palustris TaxID=2822762 RepID=A0ABS5BK98_9BACT|nr:hypothetical protein [Gemmata palustris]MBP3954127.1 hypothetical protein [Gemmata palustris]